MSIHSTSQNTITVSANLNCSLLRGKVLVSAHSAESGHGVWYNFTTCDDEMTATAILTDLPSSAYTVQLYLLNQQGLQSSAIFPQKVDVKGISSC